MAVLSTTGHLLGKSLPLSLVANSVVVSMQEDTCTQPSSSETFACWKYSCVQEYFKYAKYTIERIIAIALNTRARAFLLK